MPGSLWLNKTSGGPQGRQVLVGTDLICDGNASFNSVAAHAGAAIMGVGPQPAGSIVLSTAGGVAYFDTVGPDASTMSDTYFRSYCAGGGGIINTLHLDGSGNAGVTGNVYAGGAILANSLALGNGSMYSSALPFVIGDPNNLVLAAATSGRTYLNYRGGGTILLLVEALITANKVVLFDRCL